MLDRLEQRVDRRRPPTRCRASTTSSRSGCRVVIVSLGSARSSSHVQLTGSAPPRISNVHCVERRVRRRPGREDREVVGDVLARRHPVGRRASRRLPLNPRETITSCEPSQLAASPATVAGTPSNSPIGSRLPSSPIVQPKTRCASASIAYRKRPSRGDRLVADAVLAEPRRRSHRLEQLQRAALSERVARDRPVAEVRHVDEPAVAGRAAQQTSLRVSATDALTGASSPRPASEYDEAAALPTSPPNASVTTTEPFAKSKPYGVAPEDGIVAGPSASPSRVDRERADRVRAALGDHERRGRPG